MENVYFNRTYLNPDLFFYKIFQSFAGTAELLMTELVYGRTGCCNVSAIAVANTFRHSHDDILALCQYMFHISNKLVIVEFCFRKINEMWSLLVVVSGKSRSCGKPACVTSHNLYNCNTVHRINKGIVRNFKHRGSNVFGCGAKTRSMVCDTKIIINGFGNPDNSHIASDLLAVGR